MDEEAHQSYGKELWATFIINRALCVSLSVILPDAFLKIWSAPSLVCEGRRQIIVRIRVQFFRW